MKKIEEVFRNIPIQKVLQIAKSIQSRLKSDCTLEKQKGGDKWEWVTEADTQIQELLLNYFSNSYLKNRYRIKAEESIKKIEGIGDTQWQLLIDPLDGTGEFRKGKETWGVMAGLCDQSGVLKYSWNLLSTGDVFKTKRTRSDLSEKVAFREKVRSIKPIKIDIYDYDAGASSRFIRKFENIFNLSKAQVEQTSYPSAIWAGWQLYQGKLDGLLWISSNQGKRWYPDHDLIFLGTLPQQGFKIRLGKIVDKNSLVVVAPTEEDANSLYEVGLGLISEDQRNKITLSINPLQITKAL